MPLRFESVVVEKSYMVLNHMEKHCNFPQPISKLMPRFQLNNFLSGVYRKKDGEMVNINRNRMEGSNIDSIGLKIQKVLRTDMGNYSCELQNDYGVGISENAIVLDVHCEYMDKWCNEFTSLPPAKRKNCY